MKRRASMNVPEQIRVLARGKLAAAGAAVLAAAAMALTAVSVAGAYEQPLDSQSVREAYFLGRRGDEAMARFLAQYTRTFPLPKTGSYIENVSVLTPYAQVVLWSSQQISTGSPFDAADYYRAHANQFLVRVRIYSTPSYDWTQRDTDVKRDFPIRVVQDHELKPMKSTLTPIYARPHSGTWSGAELELEFDAAQVASAPITIEVKSPDGQRVVAKFDLEKLK